MTTIPIPIQRPAIPAGFDGLLVRLGLAISSWGSRRAQRTISRRYPRPELMREGLSADLIYYRMR